MSKKLKSKVASFLLFTQFLFTFILPLQPLVSLVQAQENQVLTFSKNESSILVSNSQAGKFSYFFRDNNTTHGSKESVIADGNFKLDLKSQSGEDETPFNVKRLVLKTDLSSYFLEIAENNVTVLKEYQSDSLELKVEEENFLVNSWQIDSLSRVATTSSDVVLNQEYRFPLNEEVQVTFTKLPIKSSPLSIQEIQLSDAQQKALGTTAKVAYDVTTAMKDGEFTFDLRLPSVTSENKDVSVKFAENITELSSAKTAENELTVVDDGDVMVKNLDHMTIFVVVYDATPGSTPPNAPSLGFQATQTSEFGDYVHLNGTVLKLNTISVLMSDWALYADYSSDIRYMGNSATWSHPITINVYSSHLGTNGAPDTLLATKTQDFDIPWRPAADPTCSTPTAWRASDNNCYNGFAFNITFDLSSLNVTLPNDVIVSIAYNTQTYGTAPIGVNGPYNSLNVLVPDNQAVSVGSDDSSSNVFWNTSTAAWYTDGGIGGYGILRQDNNWSPNGTIAIKVEAIDTSVPDCNFLNSFDSFTLGSVNGQDGWSATGPFDQAVVNNTYGYSSFGCKSLRISDAVTNGSFGDQVFAKPETNGAGETEATIGSFSEGTRQNHFEAQFDIASSTPNEGPGTRLSVSPDRGDGSRMSYLRFEDNMGGIDVYFDDALNSGPAFSFTTWNETKIASGLSNSVPHTIKFVMDFVDGPSNDVVEIYIDDNLAHTGTSWENYYRYDVEASAEQSPRIVKTLIFRESGTANSVNFGEGFLIDNVALSSSMSSSEDTTPPTVPTNGMPHGTSIPTNNFDFTWDDSSDESLPITYEFQSSLNPAQVGGILTTGLWHSGILPTAMIHSSGAPDGTWYWQVRAIDALGNTSAWSEIWNVTLDKTAPATPTGLKFLSQDRSQEFACGARVPLQVAIPDWNDVIGDPTFSHFEYTSFHPSGAIGLNEQVQTVSELNNSWMPPADGAYGFAVRSVDKAGNKSAWALSNKTLAGSCQIIYDTVSPTVDLIFTTPGPTNKGFQVVFSEDVNQVDAENPSNYFLNNWPGAGGSGDLVGDATISYNSGTKTATITFTNPGWYISPEQEWGVQNIHDLAGNIQSENPRKERSTPMVDPTDPGVATSTPNPTNSLTQVWNWLTSTDVLGSGVKGYYQRIYDVAATSFSGWTWLGNVLSSVTNLTNGQWQIQLKAEDNAGNQSGEVFSSVLNVDTVAPTATVSYSTVAPTNGNVTATLSPLESITVTNNGGLLTYNFADNGSFTFEFIDAAGNTGSTTATVSNIDKTAPSAPTSLSPTDLENVGSHNFTFSWSDVTDLNMPITYEWEASYGTATNIDGSFVSRLAYHSLSSPSVYSPGTPDNVYYWHVRAIDSVGNASAWNQTWKVTVDTIAPVTTDNIADSNWHNSDVTVNLSCADSGSLCDKTYYSINGGSFVEGSSLILSSDGEYVISYYSTDNAGNTESTKTAIHIVKIDGTDPESIITSPTNDGANSVIYTNSWDGLIAGTATDSASGLFRVDLSVQRASDSKFWTGEGWLDGTEETTRVSATGTTNWSLTLPSPAEDSYKITSHAIDNAGNVENSYKVTIVFDKTIPEINLSIDPVNPDGKNGWYTTRPTITLSMTDDKLTDYMEYQWESQTGSWNTYVSSIQPSSEGRHVLYYRAIDKAGNSSAIGIKNLAWDKTELTEGPLKVDATPDRSGGPDAKVTWEAATDNVGIDHYQVVFDLLDGDADFAEDVDSNLREFKTNRLNNAGTWKVTVTAYDSAGHAKSASDEIIVDKTAPSAPVLSLDATNLGSVDLSWTKIDDATEYVIFYGVNDGQYPYAARVGNVLNYTVQGLTAGNYYFVVRAEDGSGNQSANSNQVSTLRLLAAPGGGDQLAEGFTEAPEVLGVNTEGEKEAVQQASVQNSGPGEVQGAKDNACKDWAQNLWWMLLLTQMLTLFIVEWKIAKKQKLLKLAIYILFIAAPSLLVYYVINRDCFSGFMSWLIHYYYVAAIASAMLAKLSAYLLVDEES